MRSLALALLLCSTAAFAQETQSPTRLVEAERALIELTTELLPLKPESYDEILTAVAAMTTIGAQPEAEVKSLEEAILARLAKEKDNAAFDRKLSYAALSVLRPGNADYKAQAASLPVASSVSTPTGSSRATLEAAVARFNAGESDAQGLFDTIAVSGDLASLDATFRSELEAILLAAVKPIPSENLELNAAGYLALAAIAPDNATYAEKAKAYENRIAAHKAGLLKGLKQETDEFSGTTFYQHPNSHALGDQFVLYLGKKDDRVWGRVKFQYEGSDWLFINGVKANIDGKIVDLAFTEWERDNSGGKVWEWSDTSLDIIGRSLIEEIANSKKTVLRLNGDTYYDNWELSAKDKAMLKDMLQALDLMIADPN